MRIASLALGSGITAVILAPLIVMGWAGVSLVGLLEESVGYRYFHSLRILYGGEHPWLPQGQLMGLFHLALHGVLTGLGYPPQQLFPRLDIWTYAAAAVPLMLIVCAYWWAVSPINSTLGRLLIAVALLYVAFDRTSFNASVAVVPDYYPWAFAAAFLMVGWLVRPARLAWGDVVGLAAFTGACLSTKPTYLVFVLPVYVHLLLARPVPRTVLCLGVAGIAGAALWPVVVLCYYLGNITATVEYFILLRDFGQSVAGWDSFAAWFWATLDARPLSPPLLAFFVPMPLVVGLLDRCTWRLSLALLSSLLISLVVTAQRPVGSTFVETNALIFAVASVWFARVFPLFTTELPYRRMVGATAGLIAAGFLSWTTWHEMQYAITQLEWAASYQAAATRGLAEFRSEHPGRMVILSPDNAYRPLTVESAIYKGGTDIYDSRWGVSPYVAAMFPELMFLREGRDAAGEPMSLSEFDTLAFVVGPAATGSIRPYTGEVREREWRVTRTWLRDLYALGLQVWECPLELFSTNNSLIVGCYRRQEILNQPGTAASIPRMFDLQDETPLVDLRNRPMRMAPGQLVYVHATSELFRAEGEERYTRMVGAPGGRVRIHDRGVWLTRAQRFVGVQAVSEGGVTWKLDLPEFEPISPPLTAQTLWHEWRPSSETAMRFEWLADRDGPFLRVSAAHDDASILLQFTPPERAVGAPLTVRVVARGSRPGLNIWTTFFDRTRDGSNVPTARPGETGLDWSAFTIHVPAVRAPIREDRAGAGPAHIGPGEYVDIRSIEVYAGLLP